MIDKDRVYEIFLGISGSSDEAKGRFLCDAAAGYLSSRIGREVDLIQNMERLCRAAAGIAYCDYREMAGDISAGEVRVGDISLKESSGSGRRSELRDIREGFIEGIADLLAIPFVLGAAP